MGLSLVPVPLERRHIEQVAIPLGIVDAKASNELAWVLETHSFHSAPRFLAGLKGFSGAWLLCKVCELVRVQCTTYHFLTSLVDIV